MQPTPLTLTAIHLSEQRIISQHTVAGAPSDAFTFPVIHHKKGRGVLLEFQHGL